MIRLDVAQGSPEWLAARLGIPTASQAHRLLTPKTLKPSSQADGYLHELVAESILGYPLEEVDSDFMERGRQLEPSAVKFYQLQRDLDTEQVGFLLRDDMTFGCSPDRLVGNDGGLEIKCPAPATHVGYLLNSPGEKYKAQVQACLWVSERNWWDLLSFHPDMPPVLIRFERDEAFIKALADAVANFTFLLEAAKAKIAALTEPVGV